MSTQRHTPGPWQWEGQTLAPVMRDPSVSAVHSILERSGGYGFIGAKVEATCAELEADFELIAAAPELLRLLSWVLQAAGQADPVKLVPEEKAAMLEAVRLIERLDGGRAT